MNYYLNKKEQGTTLIEIIMYLGLFSIIIGGSVTAAYGMFESQGRNQTQSMVQEEGNFILQKIDWALTGATSVTISPSNQLLINRSGITPSENPISFYTSGGVMLMQRNGGPITNLSNTNISISNLTFIHTTSNSDGIVPESAGVTFTASSRTQNGLVYSEVFSNLKYLRK